MRNKRGNGDGKPEFLIIATSARFLAESALSCGYAVSAVDGFTDTEVSLLSCRAIRVPLVKGGLDSQSVREVCEDLIRERQFEGAIVGPGLDGHPECIEWLHSVLPVYGNAADVFALCCDRCRFIERLERLNIPHPREDSEAFMPTLLKVAGASGGMHVRFGDSDRHAYQQSYLPGTSVSHLFLASEGNITTIGWSTQWQSRHNVHYPFCYGGAVSRSTLDEALCSRTEDYATLLAQDFSLVGINSVDYVMCGNDLYLIELNPRVSATMQLHDDQEGTLFAAHLNACMAMPLSLPKPQLPRAHAVLYAPYQIAIPDGFDWLEGTHDIPIPRVKLEAGEPVCTLTASATTSTATLTRLQEDICLMNERFAMMRQSTEINTCPVAGEVVV